MTEWTIEHEPNPVTWGRWRHVRVEDTRTSSTDEAWMEFEKSHEVTVTFTCGSFCLTSYVCPPAYPFFELNPWTWNAGAGKTRVITFGYPHTDSHSRQYTGVSRCAK
jgi:hypothetical protein